MVKWCKYLSIFLELDIQQEESLHALVHSEMAMLCSFAAFGGSSTGHRSTSTSRRGEPPLIYLEYRRGLGMQITCKLEEKCTAHYSDEVDHMPILVNC
jgi:hypothetical protein